MQPAHPGSCCGMSGKASPEHQIGPVPGVPPGFHSPSLARFIISSHDLLGSPIPWLPAAALISAHALYLLTLGSLPTVHFPGPGKHLYFWAQNSFGPTGPQITGKRTSLTWAS